PSAVMLCATLAAPPILTVLCVNATTGTGASGEMRVTRPTMNLSSIASPMTRMRALPAALASRRARSGVTGGSSMRIGALRGEWQRDDDEEEHEELGVAEVVLEHAGRQHGGDGGQCTGGEYPVLTAPEDPEDRGRKHTDEAEPDRQGREAAFG